MAFQVDTEYKRIEIDHGNGCTGTYSLGDFSQKTGFSNIPEGSKTKATFTEFYNALVNGTTASFYWDVTDGSGMFRYNQETNVFSFETEKYLYGASVQMPMTPQIVTELAKLLPTGVAA